MEKVKQYYVEVDVGVFITVNATSTEEVRKTYPDAINIYEQQELQLIIASLL